MARLAVVYRKPLSIKFLAPRLSSANLWRLFTYLAIPTITLLLTFVTQGLWRRTNTYLEQPIVDFQNRLLLVLQDQNGRAKGFWSPFEEFNVKWHDKLMIPSVEMDLRDENGDFRPDEVNIRATFRPSDANFSMAQISTVFYVIFFDVRLEQRTWLEMPSTPVFGQVPKPSGPLNELNLFGLLDFVQLRPLPWYAFNLTVPAWSPSTEAWGNSTQNDGLQREEHVDLDQELDQLLWQLQLYSVAQNYTLGIGRKVEHWRRREMATSNGTSAGREEGIFYFNFRARLREQVLVYRTNIWEMLKWAWLQFLAMLVIVNALFRVLSSFLYQNQIFGTIVAVEEAGEERKKLE